MVNTIPHKMLSGVTVQNSERFPGIASNEMKYALI